MTPEPPTSAEHPVREGAPPNDGPIGGAPGPSAETDRSDDAPSGMPADAKEETPLGTDEEAPEGEGAPERGADAMPGIPTGGEPPTAG